MPTKKADKTKLMLFKDDLLNLTISKRKKYEPICPIYTEKKPKKKHEMRCDHYFFQNERNIYIVWSNLYIKDTHTQFECQMLELSFLSLFYSNECLRVRTSLNMNVGFPFFFSSFKWTRHGANAVHFAIEHAREWKKIDWLIDWWVDT